MLTAKSARSKVITYCQVIVNMTRDSQRCCGKELSLTFPEVSLKTSAVETLQVKNAFNFIKTRFCNGCVSLGVPGNFTTSLLKACVRYFLLFLKEQCVSSLFRTKYFEKKFTVQLLYLSIVSWTFFSPELPRAARLLKTSCFENIIVYVIETMLMTLPLVQMNKSRREVNQKIKHKLR